MDVSSGIVVVVWRRCDQQLCFSILKEMLSSLYEWDFGVVILQLALKFAMMLS